MRLCVCVARRKNCNLNEKNINNECVVKASLKRRQMDRELSNSDLPPHCLAAVFVVVETILRCATPVSCSIAKLSVLLADCFGYLCLCVRLGHATY